MIKNIKFDYDVNTLKKCIRRFPETNIMVIGDIIMDEYIWGDVSRISPEAPVPVVAVKQETKMLGGAANVIRNICSLGGKAILCGVTGDDATGREIVERLEELNVATDGILADPDRQTSVKTRIVANNQQVVRFDRESQKKISSKYIKMLVEFIEGKLYNLGAIIVADYGKGVVSAEMMKALRNLVKASNIILSVDPKTDNFEYYRGIDIITPNHHEAGAFCRLEIVDEETLVQAGRQMLNELDCRAVLITQGKEGMTLFEKNGQISHIPTVARKVFDVTGAGDTVISALSLGMASGMDLESAAIISNFAAGIVVGEMGTSAVSAEQLMKAINNRLI